MRRRRLTRFLRFRLVALLGALTLLCLCLGAWSHRAHRQRAAIDRVATAGGIVIYTEGDQHAASPSRGIARGERSVLDDFHRVVEIVFWQAPQSWDERFAKGKVISIHTGDSPEPEIDLAPVSVFRGLRELHLQRRRIAPASYRAIAHLPELRVLRLDCSTADDAALKQIASAQRLEHLNLAQTCVTDRGVSCLVQLEGLKELDLSGTDVTDEAMESLANCTALELLILQDTQVSRSAVDALKKERPGATIVWGKTSGFLRWDKKLRRFVVPPRPSSVPPLNSVL